MSADKKLPASGERITRSLTYVTCEKHGIRYPQGATCPACDAEKARQR